MQVESEVCIIDADSSCGKFSLSAIWALSRQILPTFQRAISPNRTVSSNTSCSATHKLLIYNCFFSTLASLQTPGTV